MGPGGRTRGRDAGRIAFCLWHRQASFRSLGCHGQQCRRSFGSAVRYRFAGGWPPSSQGDRSSSPISFRHCVICSTDSVPTRPNYQAAAGVVEQASCVPQGGFGASYAPYPSVVSLQVRKDRQGSEKGFQLCKSRFELWAIRNHALFLERSGPLWRCSRRLRCYSLVVETQTLLLLHHPPRWKLPPWCKKMSPSTASGLLRSTATLTHRFNLK